MRALVVFFLTTRALCAAYSNLIATADGSTVYFSVSTGPVTTTWYAAHSMKGGLLVEPVAHPLEDVSAGGSVQAWSYSYARRCGFGGSSCWVADWCQAAFGIEGPGFSKGGTRNQTFTRLDPAGTLAWIEQQSCRVIGSGSAPLNGLFETATLRPVAPAGGAVLASRQYGRRLITAAHQALTLAGPQLQWLDASGVHPIRNVYGAAEAVTDDAGANVVYVETGSGNLHWLTGPDWLGALDDDLGLRGSAPALTPDGASLLFLAPDGRLQRYTRATRVAAPLAPGAFLSFTSNRDAVFAVTAEGRLVHIDLSAGDSAEVLPPFPGIQSIEAPLKPGLCPYICYAPEDPGRFVDPGMLLVLRGDSLGRPGWRATSAGMETPLVPISDSAAYLQIPQQLPHTGDLQTMEISNPGHPLRYTLQIDVQSGIPVCLATVHQDFSRAVTESDPAASGEVVHVFLTGLQGTEAVADGVANPADRLIPIANAPPFAAADALQPLFFGLAPGLIGMQQLDLRVFAPAAAIFDHPYAFHCQVP